MSCNCHCHECSKLGCDRFNNCVHCKGEDSYIEPHLLRAIEEAYDDLKTGTKDSSLTRAIEEEFEKEEEIWLEGTSVENGSHSEFAKQFAIKMGLKAHELGIQEGMKRGADSAVDYIQQKAQQVIGSSGMLEGVRMAYWVYEDDLEAARTAHQDTHLSD